MAAGPTNTPGTEIYGPVVQGLGRAFAQGRVADPEEIAEPIVFLSTDRASFINGAVLQAHGGIRAIAPAA